MKKVNLTQIIDAQIWAKEWLKIIKKHPNIPTDEGTMISWFANAIMAGYDEANKRCKCDPYAKECCDICTGYTNAKVHGKLKDKVGA